MNPNRIAIVADWLIDFWWAELVISHLLEMYPSADIFTSVCYMEHPMLEWRRVNTSWLQRIPFFGRRHKLAGILRPWAFRSLDLSGYDVVICSSSAESKQVALGHWRTKNDAKVIVYCHTPIRYYWSHYSEYQRMMEYGIWNPLAKWVLSLLIGWLRKMDYAAAQRVDAFIANSETTAKRIKKYYDRESEVIYPGVERMTEEKQGKICETVELWNCETPYYLWLGRCIPYKRFDLLVDAFNKNGKRLILVTATDTPLYRELRARSMPNIEWRYRISNDEKNALMAGARAFLFPPEEDFGLVPVEAMMAGTPVIAYGKWGGTESVVDGETGVYFTPQTPEALSETIDRFETMEWDREKIQARGMAFSKEKFQENISQFVQQYVR